eukprot:1162101-Pelagomonas_calceolata.AAC.13
MSRTMIAASGLSGSHLAHRVRREVGVCGELPNLLQQRVVQLVLVKLHHAVHEGRVAELLFGFLPSCRAPAKG